MRCSTNLTNNPPGEQSQMVKFAQLNIPVFARVFMFIMTAQSILLKIVYLCSSDSVQNSLLSLYSTAKIPAVWGQLQIQHRRLPCGY